MKIATSIAAAMALASFTTARGQAADVPPVPYEDIGACPFEGCVYREWQANADVDVRAERRSNSAVVFQIAKGEKVRALTGVVVTTRAGRAQFDKPQSLNTASGVLRILPGQTLYLLTYQGEGHTKAWFNNRLYTGVDAFSIFSYRCEKEPASCPGRILEKPVSEWWIQVRNAAGQVGWTHEYGKFDNKDALGG